MDALLVVILALCSSLTSAQNISCSNLTPCREITEQHCESTQRLCVGYNDCKRCLRRVCDDDAVPCTENSVSRCGAKREVVEERMRHCPLLQDPEILKKCQQLTGKDCNWYTNCLYRYFPTCRGEENYALEYGQKYCEEFDNSYSKFTAKGQRWIDTVRRCLQIGLVDVLSADPKPSCSELRNRAIDAHPQCYALPGIGDGSVSVCDLACNDLNMIIFTIGGAVADDLWNSGIKGGSSVAGLCYFVRDSPTSSCFKWYTAGAVTVGAGATYLAVTDPVLLITLSLFGLSGDSKQRVERSIECDSKCTATAITESIFNMTNLPANTSIEWRAFPKELGEELEISVLITNMAPADKGSNSSIAAAHKALQAAANNFFTTATKQKEIIVDGRLRRIRQVSACGDLNCNKTNSRIVNLIPEINKDTTMNVNSGANSGAEPQQKNQSFSLAAILSLTTAVTTILSKRNGAWPLP